MSDTQLDTLVDDLIANAPTPNEGIVDKLNEGSVGSTTENPAASDTAGVDSTDPITIPLPFPPGTDQPIPKPVSRPEPESFDPSIHEVDDRGNPRMTADGKFRRKRGRKSGSTVSSAFTVSIPQTDKTNVDYAGIGTFLSNLMFGSCENLFGPAWKPNDTERSQIEYAAAAYCRSKQYSDVPPGIALCLCVGLYAVPRFSDPTTRERVRAIGQSFGIIGHKTHKKQNPSTQNDTTVPNAVPQTPKPDPAVERSQMPQTSNGYAFSRIRSE